MAMTASARSPIACSSNTPCSRRDQAALPFDTATQRVPDQDVGLLDSGAHVAGYNDAQLCVRRQGATITPVSPTVILPNSLAVSIARSTLLEFPDVEIPNRQSCEVASQRAKLPAEDLFE